ncbi:MAG: hypothetical protein IPG04_24825 [Polyangiaceae bacterium]|nr:hypothetical protein [Polyangiaceae bacterium]
MRAVKLLGSARGEPQGSREALVAALRRLAGAPGAQPVPTAGFDQLAPATPDDVVLITFAGHGASSPDGRFHLLLGDFAGAAANDVAPGAAGALDDLTLAGRDRRH